MSGYADIDTLEAAAASACAWGYSHGALDPVVRDERDAALSRVRELAEAAEAVERLRELNRRPGARPVYEYEWLSRALRAVREGTGE